MHFRRWQWSGRRMGVAVTFGTQAERECRENKNHHSFFRRSEEEFLSRLIEFERPAFFQFSACSFCRGRTRND